MINARDRESDAAMRADPAVPRPSAPAPLQLMLRFGGNRAVAALLSRPTADPAAAHDAVPAAGAAPPVVTGRPTPSPSALDDAAFNPTTRAHDLLRAINQEDYTFAVKGGGGGLLAPAYEEDVSAERRKIDFPTVVTALSGLTPSQVRRVEEVYLDFEKKTTLRADLFEGGQSERKADLTPDQIARLQVLLQGTKAEPLPTEAVADLAGLPPEAAAARRAELEATAEAAPALHRHQADAIELHELLGGEINETRLERIMTMHRRKKPEIEAVDACYETQFRPETLGSALTQKLDGLQRLRIVALRAGNAVQADAYAIEAKRRAIETLNAADESTSGKLAAFTSLAVGGDILAEQRREQRDKLSADIQAIIEQNKRESLADPANAGKRSGQAVAERLSQVLGQSVGPAGGTLGDDLTRALSPETAATITGAAAAAGPNSSNLVWSAAEQLVADEKAATTKATKIQATLRSFRELAQHDVMAQAYDRATSEEQRAVLLRDREGAVTRLAQHYIDEYEATYNRLKGEDGRSYDDIVQSADKADEGLINDLSVGGGQTSELGEFDHAMGKKDVEQIKTILRCQPTKKKIDALIASYDGLGGGRDFYRQMFGVTLDERTATAEQAQRGNAFEAVGGMVRGRDAAQIAEQLAKPGEGAAGGQSEAAWIEHYGAVEYEITMANRGLTGRLREIGDDPETERLLVRTRDDLLALAAKAKDEPDATKQAKLVAEMRKLRATLTGDADAYEKDNARMLADIRSALSFAVSIALAIAIPGAGATLVAFLQTTALNIAANVAANFVINGGEYGLENLKADVLGGLLGAGGAKFGEELLGKVVAVVVKPAAEATTETAARFGVKTALAAEAKTAATAAEKVAIKAEEFDIRLAVVTGAKELGGLAGGMEAPKILTGDFSTSPDEILKSLITWGAGKAGNKLHEPAVLAESPPLPQEPTPASGERAPAGGEPAAATTGTPHSGGEPAPTATPSEVQHLVELARALQSVPAGSAPSGFEAMRQGVLNKLRALGIEPPPAAAAASDPKAPSSETTGSSEPASGESGGSRGESAGSGGSGGSGREPQKAWVHPDDGHPHMHELGPTPPTETARGPSATSDENLPEYARGMRSRAQKNPATAATAGEHGPHIHDNLYSGNAQTTAVADLQARRIIDVATDPTAVHIVDPAAYIEWLRTSYADRANMHLDPNVEAAITEYISEGPLDKHGTAPDPTTGEPRPSNAGDLPGTHAEILAANDVLFRNAAPTEVAVVRTRVGEHFAACLHCANILRRLPAEVRTRILTGAADYLN